MTLYDNYTVNWYKNRDDYTKAENQAYRDRHPEFPRLEFPKYFYFRYIPERRTVHWAIIIPENNKFSVYFIDIMGQAFDKLEFKTKKQAQRGLRRNDFYFSTNKRPPCEPIQPIFVDLCKGKKTALYSLGKLLDKRYRINVKYRDDEKYNVYKNCATKKEFDIIPHIVKLLVFVAIFLLHKLLR